MGRSVLRRVSTRRYFTVSTSNASSGFAGSTSLSFSSIDLVIAKRDGGLAGIWINIDRAHWRGRYRRRWQFRERHPHLGAIQRFLRFRLGRYQRLVYFELLQRYQPTARGVGAL